MSDEKKKILMITASPKDTGFTSSIAARVGYQLLSNIEHSVIKLINVYDLNMNYCDDCGKCAKSKGCKYTDDMTGMYELFNEYDNLFVISPIYFNSVPAPFKTMVDRLQAVYNSKYKLNDSMIYNYKERKRNAWFYLVGGQEYTEDQFTGALEVLKIFFKAVNYKFNEGYIVSNTNKIKNIDEAEFINIKEL